MTGIVYIIWGNDKKIIDHLYASNNVAKRLGYSTCVVADRYTNIDKNKFNFYFTFDAKHKGLQNKSVWYDCLVFIPYDICLFLDCDAYIFDNIDYGFKMAERYEIALTIAPASSLYHAFPMNSVFRNNKTKDMVQYNTGAVFVDIRSEQVLRVLKDYHNSLILHQLAADNDQPFLSLSLNKNKLNPFVLPNTWNLRQHITQGKIHGRVKIWHGNYPQNTQLINNPPQQGLYNL